MLSVPAAFPPTGEFGIVQHHLRIEFLRACLAAQEAGAEQARRAEANQELPS